MSVSTVPSGSQRRPGTKASYLKLLRAVSEAANQATDLDAPLRACLDAACEFTGWPVGHVYIRETQPPYHLVPTNIWHFDDPERYRVFRDVTMTTPLAPGVGLPGHVLLVGRPQWIPDVTQHPNFPRAKLAKDIGVRAGFGLPIKVKDAVPAVLEFFSPEVLEPDQEVMEVMEHVGTVLGRIFERFRNLETLRTLTLADSEAFLDLLRTVTRAANEAGDLEQPLRTTLDAVCRLTGWPIGHVYMRAAEPPHDLVPSKIWHLENPERYENFRTFTEASRFPDGEGVPGRAAATGRPVWIGDLGGTFTNPRARTAKNAGLRAAFAFPIKVRDEVPGVLEFFGEESSEPHPRFLEVVSQVGVQLGRVVERMRAEEAIHNLATAVSESRGDAFFLSLCHHLARTVGADFAFIGELTQEPGNNVRTLALCGPTGVMENIVYGLSGTPCEDVVRKQPCVFPRDVQRLFPQDRILADMGIEGYAGTPLSDAAGRPLGLMVVLYRQPLEDARKVESLLRVFAVRAASELERLRAERSLAAMEIFPRADPNPVLEFAADGTLTYFNVAAERLARNMGRTHPRDILPRDTTGVVRQCLLTGVSGIVMETSEGGHTISWSFIPVLERNIVLAYAVEISFLLTLESEMRALGMLDPPAGTRPAAPRGKRRPRGGTGGEQVH
ncbi:MAG: GAF domain-containing protein [Candidatus Polarisedimenticolia bacterium]